MFSKPQLSYAIAEEKNVHSNAINTSPIMKSIFQFLKSKFIFRLLQALLKVY